MPLAAGAKRAGAGLFSKAGAGIAGAARAGLLAGSLGLGVMTGGRAAPLYQARANATKGVGSAVAGAANTVKGAGSAVSGLATKGALATGLKTGVKKLPIIGAIAGLGFGNQCAYEGRSSWSRSSCCFWFGVNCSWLRNCSKSRHRRI
jgi:hypothetical protein